ncbi:hypothetical protein TNCV_1809451 [Trichonephila clavipes]|nr:hypothetical protein TNCV_1809451 [Trichonephila clavipes]
MTQKSTRILHLSPDIGIALRNRAKSQSLAYTSAVPWRLFALACFGNPCAREPKHHSPPLDQRNAVFLRAVKKTMPWSSFSKHHSHGPAPSETKISFARPLLSPLEAAAAVRLLSGDVAL